MGDVVIGLVAQRYGKVPVLRVSPAEVLVTVFSPETQTESLKLAAELREAGLRAEWYPEAAKLDRQLKYADATGVRFAIIVGPDEMSQGIVMLKDLASRTQSAVPRAQLANRILALTRR
jgi:histidyl-tRNA synthetase